MAELPILGYKERGLERRHGLEASFMNALEAILHSYIFLDYATMDSFAMNDGLLRWLAENGLKGEEDGSDNFYSCSVCARQTISRVSRNHLLFLLYILDNNHLVATGYCSHALHFLFNPSSAPKKAPIPIPSVLFIVSRNDVQTFYPAKMEWVDVGNHLFSKRWKLYSAHVACLVPVLPLKADANFTHKKQLFIVQHAILNTVEYIEKWVSSSGT